MKAKKATSKAARKPKPISKEAVGIKYGFRSGLEKRIFQELSDAGVTFGYEDEVIEYIKPARKSKYTRDFTITHRPDGTLKERPLLIESKGRFLTEDRQKHILIKDQHPDKEIRFIFSNPKQRISKQSRTTYAMWCEKNGFKYAAHSVPQEWLWE